jgi:alpha-tubulin suppressor-like RCC1 family protein
VQSPIKVCTEGGVRFQDLALGKGRESFGAALDTDGFVYSWGDNQTGQLGLGDFSARKLPTKINQLRKKKVNLVSCGAGFVVALGKDVPEGFVKPKKTKRVKDQQKDEQRTFDLIPIP